MPDTSFDVIIIGSEPSGYVTAMRTFFPLPLWERVAAAGGRVRGCVGARIPCFAFLEQ